jgi:hypothetical protein
MVVKSFGRESQSRQIPRPDGSVLTLKQDTDSMWRFERFRSPKRTMYALTRCVNGAAKSTPGLYCEDWLSPEMAILRFSTIEEAVAYAESVRPLR